ncbi:hypothetical protein [Phaeodactylibacter luteus]|uniref:Uncharacterized protein n=1 Tax=Phaeodactylibacter luteus TaxID=1564516 RepID=A0A5C6RG02_9BACT|nr:hypothetical protein [Phaeodactylibacter luteus]TXB58622.1 hypothetical protein FRY97_21510 [Phaeodactylibacter luteus]
MIESKDIKLYKLIAVGHLSINLPVVIISLGIPRLMADQFETVLAKTLAFVFGLLIGIVLSWGIWSVLIVKWRVWAFNQVEENDFVRLKELAIRNKLIWESGSKFETTEFRTELENEKITVISEKIFEFEQIEEVKLDLKTPNSVEYRLSKKQNIMECLSMIIVTLVSIGLLFTNLYAFGLIMMLIILFDLKNIEFAIKSLSNEIYMKINADYIQIGLEKESIVKWGKIINLRIDRENRKMLIEYEKDGSEVKLEVDLWRLKSYNRTEFDKLVKVFYERYKLKMIK